MNLDSGALKCGFIAVVGRPNVGKSTLINHLVGFKVSITTDRPQTTRQAILGIRTEDDFQFVFVDTPGIHLGEKKQINRLMNRIAISALNDSDLIMWLVEAGQFTKEDESVLNHLQQSGRPVILVINKVDKVPDKAALLPYIQQMQERYDFREIIPVSALKDGQFSGLEKILAANLPDSPRLFDEDQITDRTNRFLIAELVREKLMKNLTQELPYSLAVEIEQIERTDKIWKIHALIWVEREGQKRIVIGKGGAMLKKIGISARKDIERMFEIKVNLKLWVKVKEGWSDDQRALKSLGINELE